MTDPSPRKEAEDCWQTALIRMEPNQIRLIASAITFRISNGWHCHRRPLPATNSSTRNKGF
jgi:hypothetical protein